MNMQKSLDKYQRELREKTCQLERLAVALAARDDALSVLDRTWQQLDEQLTELTSRMETLKEEHSSQLEVVTEEKAGLQAELAESKAAAEMAEATAEVAPTVSTHSDDDEVQYEGVLGRRQRCRGRHLAREFAEKRGTAKPAIVV